MGGLVSVLDNWDTWGVFLALSALNLIVLLARTSRGARLRARLLHFLRRISRSGGRGWLDWRPLTAVAGVWLGAFMAWHFATGQYGCLPNGLLSDPLGEADSGRAFWLGRNPFEGVAYCGTSINVPYGLAAVLLDAIGSLGGVIGILVIWGAVALLVLPLVWATAGPDRAYVTVFVATSILYVPLIASEFSGVTNAIVPVILLLVLYFASRREGVAAAVGGFLSTARFPAVFPVLGSTGSFARHRYLAFAGAAAAFAAATALCYLVWGAGFTQSVFISQATRRDYSLNAYGILLFENALPTAAWIEFVQAGLTLALVLVVFFEFRSPARAMAVTMVGVALLTPFLAYNFLIWLLPVALIGARARWWLWGIASVAWLNFNLGIIDWASSGFVVPAEAMDVLLTILLLGLFADLWRGDRSSPPLAGTGPAPSPLTKSPSTSAPPA
jgi:hypothetical protein